MKKTVLIILILTSLKGYTQITFEKGYFIDNEGNRIDCLIKNEDWSYNPIEFDYKNSEETMVQTASINDVKEFGIEGYSKYIRFRGAIDVSPDDFTMATSRAPDFQNRTIFLQYLIEGEANLLYYENFDSKRYFFSTETSEITPLLYKVYSPVRLNVVENNKFRQQLWSYVRCDGTSPDLVEELRYDRPSLIKYFKGFHECKDVEYVDYQKQRIEHTDFISLNIRPGIHIGSFKVDTNLSGFLPAEINEVMGLSIGLELEVLTSFNGKWAASIQPTYQFVNKSRTLIKKDNSFDHIFQLNYHSIEIPLGLKYYMFLNKNNKAFITLGGIYDKPIGESFQFERYYSKDIQIVEKFNGWGSFSGFLGIGFSYKRFISELRLTSKRNLRNHPFNEGYANYAYTALVLGYKIF